jgi:MOSC domain-containing protein YiiM
VEYGSGRRRAKGDGRATIEEKFMNASIRAVHVGRVAPLGPDAVPSGFFKQPVAGRVPVGRLGLTGDEQADKAVHGGPDKAVYAYPTEGYAAWIDDFPARRRTLVPGGMGENLATAGLTEDAIHIGDVLRIGDATLQVTQPRQPCHKLGLYHREPKMIRRMIETARCGWYMRVLVPGAIGAGDTITLVERQEKSWTIRRFAALIALKSIDAETLAEIVAMPGLAESWQLRALRLMSELRETP